MHNSTHFVEALLQVQNSENIEALIALVQTFSKYRGPTLETASPKCGTILSSPTCNLRTRRRRERKKCAENNIKIANG